MKSLHAMVLFIVFITSVSSTLCVSPNNDGNQEEISMVVVEDQPTVHDAGIGISKANPAQMALLVLEDGKVLKFSRKSSPGENCIGLGQPCGVLDHCCDPYYCSGYVTGRCQSDYCQRAGIPCSSNDQCCGQCFKGFCVG